MALIIKVNGSDTGYEIHDVGTQIIKHISWSTHLVAFCLPDHVSNELLETEEWRNFESLLEKHQREDYQRRRQAAERRQENLYCKETCVQQFHHSHGTHICQRALDIFLGVFRHRL